MLGRRAGLLGVIALSVFVGWTVFGGGIDISSAASRDVESWTPTAVQGAPVYAAKCARCHGSAGEGADEGPSLRSVLKDQTSISGVVAIARDGVGKDDMPAFKDELSATEIQAVAEYVVAQFGTEGHAMPGGVDYRLNCASCHGVMANGGAIIYNQAANAPELLNTSPAKIADAVRGGPGTMPAFAPQGLSDQQVASISQYIKTLREQPRPGGIQVAHLGPVGEGAIAILGLVFIVLSAMWVERGGRG